LLSTLFPSTPTATSALYTLSLHDALPIYAVRRPRAQADRRRRARLVLHGRFQLRGRLLRQVHPTFKSRRAANLERHPLRQHPRRSEEHTSELQSRFDLVCRLLLEKKKNKQ